MISIALPKGRLGETAYRLLESAGYGCPELLSDTRKLVFEDEGGRVRYYWVKPADVAIYTERGAADLGIAGLDILLEHSPDIYRLLDLGIGVCRMAVAARRDFTDDSARALRVATKFPNIARKYYIGRGREIDIIKLNGSIELAPLLGLSDVIVDIVETGVTLKQNDLEVREEIAGISAMLVANKASFRFKNSEIGELTRRLAGVVAPKEGGGTVND